ncbi:hypothetical protein [Escherichia coli]|nr:hypothetical protein [Escherichia coli]
MSDLSPLIHEKVHIVMTIENGQVTDTRKVRDNELIEPPRVSWRVFYL